MTGAASSRRAADRVGAAGAVLAAAGVLVFPLVVVRANRLVEGLPMHLWSGGAGAGMFAWLLPALAVAALGLALAPLGRRRGVALQAASGAMVVALAWILGASATRLLAGDVTGYARVSMATGSWLYIAGAAIIGFAAGKADYDARTIRWALIAATVGGVLAAAVGGGLTHLSIFVEYANQTVLFWTCTLQHIYLAGTSLLIGIFIGVPLGIASSRNRTVRSAALGITGIIQTFPSLALLGLLVVPLAGLAAAYPLLQQLGVQGIGPTPAIIALTLYALLPIVRNTYVGLNGVDPAATDAGRGMGMSGRQLLWRVEMPLALPLVLEGVRAAAVLVIGITVVTALVGAGGLGVIVFQGMGQQADDLIVLGAVPVILLAIGADALVRGGARLTVSPGIRRRPS